MTNKNFPQRKKLRLKNYDYSSDGGYFLTICTHQKFNFFGKIENDKMILNELGKISRDFWLKIPNFYNSIKLDEFIIMPNHIHGIIFIENPVRTFTKRPNQNFPIKKSELSDQSITKSPYGLCSKIIKSFKQITTKNIRQNFPNIGFCWQKSFYDQIIRNEEELLKIRKYIKYNPQNWQTDKNFKI